MQDQDIANNDRDQHEHTEHEKQHQAHGTNVQADNKWYTMSPLQTQSMNNVKTDASHMWATSVEEQATQTTKNKQN